MDIYNGYYIVQDGPKFFTAIQLACSEGDVYYHHILIISGPFNTYEEADKRRKGVKREEDQPREERQDHQDS